MNLDNNNDDLKTILSEIKDNDNLLIKFASNRIASKWGQNDLAINILENR